MDNSINKTLLANRFGWRLNFFTKKINTTPGLLQELKDVANYYPYQRLFTPKQVEIIYKYLGNPEKPFE